LRARSDTVLKHRVEHCVQRARNFTQIVCLEGFEEHYFILQ
jgi:hypothetical protein